MIATDESAFIENSLKTSIPLLDLYLSRYTSANSFTQFVLLSKNDGSVIVRCPMRPSLARMSDVVALHKARNHVTTACSAMAVPRYRNAVVLHRLVAFLDDVRRHVRMLRARYMVTFAGNVAAIEFHAR